jgi:hypothetical protein
MFTVQVNLNGAGWTNRDPVPDTPAAEAVIANMQEARNRARSFDLIATGPQVGDLPTAEVRVVDETGTVVIEPRTLA